MIATDHSKCYSDATVGYNSDEEYFKVYVDGRGYEERRRREHPYWGMYLYVSVTFVTILTCYYRTECDLPG